MPLSLVPTSLGSMLLHPAARLRLRRCSKMTRDASVSGSNFSRVDAVASCCTFTAEKVLQDVRPRTVPASRS